VDDPADQFSGVDGQATTCRFTGPVEIFTRCSPSVPPCSAPAVPARGFRPGRDHLSNLRETAYDRVRTAGLEVTRVNRFLSNIVSWLRSGYPDGVPEQDSLPILALLSRGLSKDEVTQIARELKHVPDPGFIDIGAEILRITDELPIPADVERVRAKLARYGWPLDDQRDSEDAG